MMRLFRNDGWGSEFVEEHVYFILSWDIWPSLGKIWRWINKWPQSSLTVTNIRPKNHKKYDRSSYLITSIIAYNLFLFFVRLTPWENWEAWINPRGNQSFKILWRCQTSSQKKVTIELYYSLLQLKIVKYIDDIGVRRGNYNYPQISAAAMLTICMTRISLSIFLMCQ